MVAAEVGLKGLSSIGSGEKVGSWLLWEWQHADSLRMERDDSRWRKDDPEQSTAYGALSSFATKPVLLLLHHAIRD